MLKSCARTLTPFEDTDDVGEVVAPDGVVGTGFELFPVGIVGECSGLFGSACHNNPLGGFFAARPGGRSVVEDNGR